jgi:hypothetical protein
MRRALFCAPSLLKDTLTLTNPCGITLGKK